MENQIYPYSIGEKTVFIEASNINVRNDDEYSEIITVSRKNEKNKGKEKGFEKLMITLEDISSSLINTVKSIQPDEFEVELGLSITGELGIPFITKTASEGTFKATIKWKKDNKNNNG